MSTETLLREVDAHVGVQQRIRLTARHGSIDPGEVDTDAALFLDCDMGYRNVPPELYRTGRGAFLRKLLARPSIYLSPFFHAEREAAARANIQRAIERLSS